MKQQYPTAIPSKKDAVKKPDILAKSAYLLFYGLISVLIALFSLLFIFTLISFLAGDPIPGVTMPANIPRWGIALILLGLYVIIVLPLKSLRFKLSPHKNYALHDPDSKRGDATLWLAFFILLAWYVSEHRAIIAGALRTFPDWWRGFVDTAGPWFYR